MTATATSYRASAADAAVTITDAVRKVAYCNGTHCYHLLVPIRYKHRNRIIPQQWFPAHHPRGS